MKEWFIVSAYDIKELVLLLDRMGAEYVSPTCLRTTISREKLRLRSYNLLGGYAFAKLDVEKQYYYLLHNEMFYRNVIDILRIGNSFISAEGEIDKWKRIAQAISLPLRLYMKNGIYFISNKGLENAYIIHYYRRKLKATIEIPICGKTHRMSIAAFDVGNISPEANELEHIYGMMSEQMLSEKTSGTTLINDTLRKIRIMHRQKFMH